MLTPAQHLNEGIGADERGPFVTQGLKLVLDVQGQRIDPAPDITESTTRKIFSGVDMFDRPEDFVQLG